MAPIFFRSRPTRIDAVELRRRLADDLGVAFPRAGIAVDERDGNPVLAWRDGPAAGSVADVTGRIVNWDLRSAGLPPEGSAPAILVDRSFSATALAVAVVRYRASHARPYDSNRATAVEDLTALLEVDDPEVSGYPVADAVAALLLAAPEPASLDVAPDATGADRLSAKLTAVGYDALWARAWSELA